MDVNSYLERIGWRGRVAPTAANLRALQLAHLRTVPFENLSIHNHEPIVLQTEALFEKIVTRRRGGFCYEANGLFAALLRELGFKVEMLSAEVANAAGEFSAPFDHMTLLVTLDQRWLADVGFGDSFLQPLLLDTTDEQVQGTRAYRIHQDGSYFVLMQRNAGEDWKPQYRFTLAPHSFADFEERCIYQQTSPASHFTQGRICTRVTEDGRLTLSDLRLITTKADERKEINLENEADFSKTLREEFGIVLAD